MVRSRAAAVGLLLAIACPVSAHEGSIEIRSTEAGGGALVATNLPDEPISAPLVYCASGNCFYASEAGSIVTPASDHLPAGLFALTDRTSVRIQIDSIDPGASVKVGSAKLDRAGESSNIGKAQDLHAHVFWQIDAPQGQTGDWRIVFRFNSGALAYTTSSPIEVIVTNRPSTATTSTTSTTIGPSSTTTSTTAASAVCGDGVLEGDEDCDAGDTIWVAGRACDASCRWVACGDPDADGEVRASDALFTLAAAVATASCEACVCNVDGSTPSGVTGGDALRILRHAIGVDTAPLVCPPCTATADLF
jgi:hypothetical protein